MGLAIAYGTFRRGRRQLISSTFQPLLGARGTEGVFGRAIDILAIFATLFGSAASLGLRALQIGGGLMAAGFLDSVGTTLLVAIVAILTMAFVASAVSGWPRASSGSRTSTWCSPELWPWSFSSAELPGADAASIGGRERDPSTDEDAESPGPAPATTSDQV